MPQAISVLAQTLMGRIQFDVTLLGMLALFE
jgi:hypothetical protein